jgi:hypothetical protein
MADAMAKPMKSGRQVAQALGGPQQRCHRIATRRRFYQFLEVGEQRGVADNQRLATAAFTAHPSRPDRRCLTPQLHQPAADRAAR